MITDYALELLKRHYHKVNAETKGNEKENGNMNTGCIKQELDTKDTSQELLTRKAVLEKLSTVYSKGSECKTQDVPEIPLDLKKTSVDPGDSVKVPDEELMRFNNCGLKIGTVA